MKRDLSDTPQRRACPGTRVILKLTPSISTQFNSLVVLSCSFSNQSPALIIKRRKMILCGYSICLEVRGLNSVSCVTLGNSLFTSASSAHQYHSGEV